MTHKKQETGVPGAEGGPSPTVAPGRARRRGGAGALGGRWGWSFGFSVERAWTWSPRKWASRPIPWPLGRKPSRGAGKPA